MPSAVAFSIVMVNGPLGLRPQGAVVLPDSPVSDSTPDPRWVLTRKSYVPAEGGITSTLSIIQFDTRSDQPIEPVPEATVTDKSNLSVLIW